MMTDNAYERLEVVWGSYERKAAGLQTNSSNAYGLIGMYDPQDGRFVPFVCGCGGSQFLCMPHFMIILYDKLRRKIEKAL